eukprot:TRINITY_DN1929_c0_g1_i10.p1 TRINITY_DN1929_c0_g1~~TRINITY_DN1929_c0_g1_i10.p1  ORF type:complete len:511 (-),score=149.57 TRINITY_DN1929_c0_g1_i10:231-1763(-)
MISNSKDRQQQLQQRRLQQQQQQRQQQQQQRRQQQIHKKAATTAAKKAEGKTGKTELELAVESLDKIELAADADAAALAKAKMSKVIAAGEADAAASAEDAVKSAERSAETDLLLQERQREAEDEDRNEKLRKLLHPTKLAAVNTEDELKKAVENVVSDFDKEHKAVEQTVSTYDKEHEKDQLKAQGLMQKSAQVNKKEPEKDRLILSRQDQSESEGAIQQALQASDKEPEIDQAKPNVIQAALNLYHTDEGIPFEEAVNANSKQVGLIQLADHDHSSKEREKDESNVDGLVDLIQTWADEEKGADQHPQLRKRAKRSFFQVDLSPSKVEAHRYSDRMPLSFLETSSESISNSEAAYFASLAPHDLKHMTSDQVVHACRHFMKTNSLYNVDADDDVEPSFLQEGSDNEESARASLAAIQSTTRQLNMDLNVLQSVLGKIRGAATAARQLPADDTHVFAELKRLVTISHSVKKAIYLARVVAKEEQGLALIQQTRATNEMEAACKKMLEDM